MKINQTFVIVSRNLDNEIRIKYTNDLIEAICIQKGFVVGMEPSAVKPLIKEEEVNEVIKNLETSRRDRIANDEEEAYIFFLPSIEKFR